MGRAATLISPSPVTGIADTYRRFAETHGLGPVTERELEPLTPLLLEGYADALEPSIGGTLAPALSGRLPGGLDGTLAHFAYKRNATFRFQVVIAEVPEALAVVPRLFCIRRDRATRDDVFYGFEARHSKLWTESVALSERYLVSTSILQDDNWMLQLFSPKFIDWLCTGPPADFSFELAYGALVASIEADDPGPEGIEALCTAAAHVAQRIGDECKE